MSESRPMNRPNSVIDLISPSMTVPPASPERLDRLDALRGLAIVWMAVFHFSFDLNHFGWIRQDFYRDPVWTWQRTCIVSLFLFCAGGGQAFAVLAGQSAAIQRLRRQIMKVASASAPVLATMPESEYLRGYVFRAE